MSGHKTALCEKIKVEEGLTRTRNKRGLIFGSEFYRSSNYSCSSTFEFLPEAVVYPEGQCCQGYQGCGRSFHITWKSGQGDFSRPLQFLNLLTHFNDNIVYIMV